MKDQETVQKFIELRAQGWSFVRIAAELGVAKSTPTEWSRKSASKSTIGAPSSSMIFRIASWAPVAGLAEKLGKV